MSRKTAELHRKLDESDAQLTFIYQEILSQVVDIQLTARLLRELEAITLRRQHIHRQLETEIERSKSDWWSRVLYGR